MRAQGRPRLEVQELTAVGRGAVSVLALRGRGALERVRRLAGRPGLETGKLALVRLQHGAELLDEALCFADSEQCVELHLHGSPRVVRRVVEELGGAAPPPPRTLEERAHELLARAASEAAARILLDQAGGALRASVEELLAGGPRSTERAAALLERWAWMRRLLTPPRVVLAGPVNAGKSTLFNVLVGRERVVVDDEHGTTRDAVRERVRLGAYAVDLVDTAGEREAPGEGGAARVERAGQRLGRELRRSADLVLWLDPGPGRPMRAGSGPAAETGTNTRVVRSRADEGGRDASDLPRLSALTDPEGARATVTRVVHAGLGLPGEPWTPGRAVPFDAEQAAILERLLAGDEVAARSDLERLLAG